MSKYKTKEYKAWIRIKDRCYNRNSKLYPTYGGSGILMDEDIKEDFCRFLEEVGSMPDHLTRSWEYAGSSYKKLGVCRIILQDGQLTG